MGYRIEDAQGGGRVPHELHALSLALVNDGLDGGSHVRIADEDGIISGDYPMLFANALTYVCTVPEPGAITLFGLCVVAAAFLRRRNTFR